MNAFINMLCLLIDEKIKNTTGVIYETRNDRFR